MEAADFRALLPFMIIAGTAVLALLEIAWRRSHLLVVISALAGLAAAFWSLRSAAEDAPRRIAHLLIVDSYSLFFVGLIIAAAFATAFFSYGYLKKHEGRSEELYVLLLGATLGAAVLVSSTHFVSFFLGLEILGVSLYAMIAYLCAYRHPLEAGIKYLVLAAASAAFLLFGMALIYAETGTMEFSTIVDSLRGNPGSGMVLLPPGMALIFTGIGFKLGVVPFHMWTPDVYEGAPGPVTGFLATVSKGAVFAFLLRYFYLSEARNLHSLNLMITIVAIASMFAGNLLALLQNNVKRILAYSSIAHFGYLLVTLMAGGVLGPSAAAFYLVAYFVTTLGAFGVVIVLSDGKRDADSLEDYRGLFWRRPVLAGFFTAMLFSLAGIPLTAGFLGKFYIVAAGAGSALWALIVILVITSAIGLFYYLRIIVTMFGMTGESSSGLRSRPEPLSFADGVILAVLAVLLVSIGVYPTPLLNLIQTAIAGMV
jgi:NADH-quinone oxidoreductase subunit N